MPSFGISIKFTKKKRKAAELQTRKNQMCQEIIFSTIKYSKKNATMIDATKYNYMNHYLNR